jgi:hypothetical protein
MVQPGRERIMRAIRGGRSTNPKCRL